MDKKRVCVVGATGSVGQEFIQSLNNHPWFELTQIAASNQKALAALLTNVPFANVSL